MCLNVVICLPFFKFSYWPKRFMYFLVEASSKNHVLVHYTGKFGCEQVQWQRKQIFPSCSLIFSLSILTVLLILLPSSPCRQHAPPASLTGPEPTAHAGAQQEVRHDVWPKLRHTYQRLRGEHRVSVFIRLERVSSPLPGICQCRESPQTGGPELTGTDKRWLVLGL